MSRDHRNPSYKKRVAVAPYNFVPLPETILVQQSPLPTHDRYHPDLLTGTLRCTLTTASPLYVRAARTLTEYNPKNGEKNEPLTPSDPFYGETKETLLIPGSSLRGMFRNLVEVISYSRLSPVTRKPLFFRTVDVSSIGKAYGKRMSGGDAGEQGWFTLAKAGYMELRNGDYFIRPAKEILGTQHYRIHEDIALEAKIPGLTNMANQKNDGKWTPNREYHWVRHPVWFKPVAPTSHLPESPTYYADVSEIKVQDELPDASGWERGYFIAGGWVPSPKGGKGKKRHWIVGPAVEGDSQDIPVSDEDISLYSERTGGYTQAIDKAKMSVLPKEGECLPCFYTFWQDEEGKQRVAFGHTGMFRLPYQQSPGQMLPNELTNAKGYDLAEAMFGFVDQTKSERGAVAGRVFVTDAKLLGDPKQAVMKEIILSDQALSGPKPTTIQHYLTQSDPDHPENLKHYDSDPNLETNLRGHKFYWHVGASKDVEKRLARAPEHRPGDKLNRFKPVKEGQAFAFEIHFENLRYEELGALLWILDKARDKHRLKLGMGKPYGLGSVEITYAATLTDRKARYSSLFSSKGWNEGILETGRDQKIAEARQRFHEYVLENEKINPKRKESIDELPRIQELLTLLTWEGHPEESKTRYMELKEFTGQKHIFSELEGKASRRPVLPAAGKVIDNQWFKGLPNEEPRAGTRKASGLRQPARNAPAAVSSHPVPTPKVVTPPPVKRERPPREKPPEAVNKTPSQLAPGDVIYGIVMDNTGAHQEVSLALLNGGEEDIAVIPAEKSGFGSYKREKKVLLRVLGIEGNENTGYKITCEPVDV